MPHLNTSHVTSRAPATVSGNTTNDAAKALPKAPAAQTRPATPPALTNKIDGAAANTKFAAMAPEGAEPTAPAASTSAAGKTTATRAPATSASTPALTPERKKAYTAVGKYLNSAEGARPDAQTIGLIHQEAGRLKTQAFNKESYKPLSAQETMLVGTDELLQMPDTEKAKNSRADLQAFRDGYKARIGNAEQKPYAVKLESNMVGETAHVHAANALTNGNMKAVMSEDEVKNKNSKIAQFMPPGSMSSKTGFSTELSKSKLNHAVIAPNTVMHTTPNGETEYPTDAHEKIRKSFVGKIPPERINEINGNVDAKMNAINTAGGSGAPDKPRVGIWVRHTDAGDGRTDTQNMTKDRFQQILKSTHEAYPGGADLVILGDGIPPGQQANWLAGTAWGSGGSGAKGGKAGKASDVQSHGGVVDFSRPWDKSNSITNTKLADPNPGQQRGYGEQVAIYDRLYREHNMQAIVTNKSGGPDLPSLAGIPQIALSDVNKGDVMANHRLYMQSLTSHSHTVVPVSLDDKQAGAALSQGEQANLTSMLQRAPQVRKFDIDRRNELDAMEAGTQ